MEGAGLTVDDYWKIWLASVAKRDTLTYEMSDYPTNGVMYNKKPAHISAAGLYLKPIQKLI